MFYITIGAVVGFLVSVIAGRMGVEDIASNPWVTTGCGAFLGAITAYGS